MISHTDVAVEKMNAERESWADPDEKRRADAQLETKLLQGLNSPESELTPAVCRDIRKEALATRRVRVPRRDLRRSASGK